MEVKKRANRNIKAIMLSLSFAASSSVAIDLEAIYAEHAELCMTQLNTEEQNLFKRLFNAEITEECVQDAIKKTSEEFDATFFKNKISDQEYRRELSRFNALTDKKIPDNLRKETDSAIENYTIISRQNKPRGDSLPTAPGYKSIGARPSEKN